MESFKLKIEKKIKPYYNKFDYKATLHLEGVGYTYYTENIDVYINRIEGWKQSEAKDGWRRVFGAGSWDDIDYDLIEMFLNFRNTMPKDKIMCRIAGSFVSFYTNDLRLFNGLTAIDPNLTLSKAELMGSKDTIYFKKNPKYKYRTYFKGKRMPINFPENVTQFMDTYSSVKVCNGLQRFVDSRVTWHKYIYLHGSFHIDYNDESMLTILHMFFGGMIGKTYSLAKQP